MMRTYYEHLQNIYIVTVRAHRNTDKIVTWFGVWENTQIFAQGLGALDINSIIHKLDDCYFSIDLGLIWRFILQMYNTSLVEIRMMY